MAPKEQILDIAMNLTRVGNWGADDFTGKRTRIHQFLQETSVMLNTIHPSQLSSSFQPTFSRFLEEYNKLTRESQSPVDPLAWSERMMTWGNILTHRASLI